MKLSNFPSYCRRLENILGGCQDFRVTDHFAATSHISGHRVVYLGERRAVYQLAPPCPFRLSNDIPALKILLANVRQERERSHQTRCCARDGGRPSEAGLQEQASNNHKLRWSKARVVSVMEKARLDRVMCRSRRQTSWRRETRRSSSAARRCSPSTTDTTRMVQVECFGKIEDTDLATTN
jgi:hypothetical protein